MVSPPKIWCAGHPFSVGVNGSAKFCKTLESQILPLTTAMSEIQSTFSPVRACIFDVDGLLINSEDLYTEIYNNILHSYGKPDLPWSIKAKQQSRGREVPSTLPHPPPPCRRTFELTAETKSGHAPAPRLGPITNHL